MNCSLSKVQGLIWLAISALGAAILAAWLWMTALPLFAAAALVLSVTGFFIPEIRKEIDAYVKCRGQSDWCSLTTFKDALAYVVTILGAVAFAAAGVLQLAALAAVASVFLSWLGVSMMVAVQAMVYAGSFACGLAILWLLRALIGAQSYRDCMDNRKPDDRAPGTGGVMGDG